MLPDPHVPTPQIDRCPQCSGAVRPGAPWCTQCWTDLRPPAPAEPEPAPDVVPPARHARPGQPTAEAPLETLAAETLVAERPTVEDDAAQVTWPCSRCGASTPIELTVCAGCGAGFLDDLRGADGPKLVLPVVGDVNALGKGQRYALAGGVVVVLLLLVALLGVMTS